MVPRNPKVPRVASRGSAETDQNCLGRNSKPSLSLSCPSVWRWRCSTHFLVSAHVARQSKSWGANTAAYCTGGSLPRCRWMWLVGLLVSAHKHCYCHINMLLFNGCQPLVANCTPFFSIPGQFLKSVERDPHLLKDDSMWSLKRFFWPPPNVGRRRVHYQVGGGASLSHGQATSVAFWVVSSRGMLCMLCGESQHEVFCPTSARARKTRVTATRKRLKITGARTQPCFNPCVNTKTLRQFSSLHDAGTHISMEFS